MREASSELTTSVRACIVRCDEDGAKPGTHLLHALEVPRTVGGSTSVMRRSCTNRSSEARSASSSVVAAGGAVLIERGDGAEDVLLVTPVHLVHVSTSHRRVAEQYR